MLERFWLYNLNGRQSVLESKKMGRPIESSPELQEHWASAPSHGSDIEAEDGTAPRLNRRANLGWAGLVLVLTVAGLLTAGYTLGLLGDWGGIASFADPDRDLVCGRRQYRRDRRGSFHREQRASG